MIGSGEIGSTSAQELDDVLRLVPGIDLLGYSGESQHPTSDSIGMRGLGGSAQGISRALVMLDGIPINDAFFGYIQWGRLPLDNIDRVEVVRGGGSPLWGNYAEGGVINVITKDPRSNQVSFDAGGGSYGSYRASISGASSLSDAMKLSGTATLSGTDGAQLVPPYERTPFNVPSSFHSANLTLRDAVALDPGTTAHVSLSYHENHQRLETLLDDNAQNVFSLTGDIRRRFDGGAALAATVFFSDSDFHTNNSTYFVASPDTLSQTTQSLNEIHHVQSHDTGGSLIWTQDLDGTLKNWMAGVDFHFVQGGDHIDHFVDPNFAPSRFSTYGSGGQTFAGAFVQASASPLDPLTVSASGRLQYLGDSNGYDGSVGGARTVADQNYTSFDPRVDLQYRLGGGLSGRAAWYRSFRAPNIGDQFYTYAAGGFVQLPSPTLQPEKLSGEELGLDFNRPGLRSQLTLYRSTIDNYIVIEPASNPIYSPAGWYVVQNVNVASVLAQGIEAEVEFDLGSGLSSRFAYTLAESVVQSNPLDPGSVGQQVIDVPKNRIAADLTYRARAGWRVSTQLFYVDRTAWSSPDHTPGAFPGATSADPHFLADVSGSYPIYGKIEAYAQIQNLFNRRYLSTSYSAPSPQTYGSPFSVFFGVRGTFP